ncbi:hypothetical protein D3C83_73530 [compost metagenome]
MRHKPANSAIAVEEWMNPCKSVMGRCRSKNSFRDPQTAIGFFKAREKTRNGPRAYRNVFPNLNRAFPELTGDDWKFFFGVWIFNPTQVVRQRFVESVVNFAKSLARGSSVF